ncbi:MAG: ABC transporter permease [Terriglobia bacterium]
MPSIFPYLNPVTLFFNLWRHRDLIAQFTVREVEGRYRGSFLGVLWSFANPLLMLTTYTLVFGVIFRSRWSGSTQNLGEVALVVFCGLIAFNLFNECVSRAAGLIVAVPSYVKKIVFPLEVLPVSVLGSALFHGLISLTVLFAGVLLAAQKLPATLLLLPLVAVPLVFLSLGVSWFLAGLGVFMRDIQHLAALLLQILLFATPIFYSLEIVPQPLRTVVSLNPLTPAVENFRRVILWGMAPLWMEWMAWTIASGGVLLLGYAWFMRTKKAFADVI